MIDVEISAVGVTLDGQPCIYASSKDITERKQAENQLIERERMLQALFDNAAIGISQVALDGRYLQVNQEYCRLLGYSKEEF